MFIALVVKRDLDASFIVNVIMKCKAIHRVLCACGMELAKFL